MPKQKNPPKEVSFWLVKIHPNLMADLEAFRIKTGLNKKTFVANALRLYLESQKSVQFREFPWTP